MAANHYATLGVAPNSPRELIRAAYLQLMRRYHPDKNPSAEAAARVRAITAAYAVLSVAEERAKYDARRSQRAAPRPEPAAEGTWRHRTVMPALMAAGAAIRGLVVERARLHRAAWPALIAGGAGILALVAYVVPAWVVPERGVERTSVGGKTMTSASPPMQYAAAAATPSDSAFCSSEVAAQSITRELFRRAARVPGSNAAALHRISAYSLVRFASPVVNTGAQEGAAISCKARVVLHLPLGVTASGGRQSVDGIVAYSLRGAGAGGPAALSLTAEPAFVKGLSSLAETSSGASELQPPTIAELLPTVMQPEIAPTPAIAPKRVAPVQRPQPQSRIVEQHPSFSCSGQRSWAEKSVCTSAGLAALDRAMASLLADAMEQGNTSQRALLLGSDKRFIAARNLCSSESCVGDAYLAGMNNIRAIMSGTPQPR